MKNFIAAIVTNVYKENLPAKAKRLRIH